MRNLTTRLAVLPVMAVAASLALDAPAAHAQNIFDVLFGGNQNRHQRAQPPQRHVAPPPRTQVAPQPEPPRRAPPRVAGPQYYDYRPEALSRVDFSPLLDRPRPAAVELSPVDQAFSDALAHLDGFVLRAEKEISAALVDHYRDKPNFIWITDGDVGPKAREAMKVLARAASFGLEPADYHVSLPANATNTADRTAALVHFEMTLSARVLRYLLDARAGRIVANKLSGYHDFDRKRVDFAAALRTMSRTREMRTYLESRHPQHPEFEALKRELAALRRSEEETVAIAPGTLLRPGATSAEFPKILQLIARDADDTFRAEHGPLLAAWFTSETYDRRLEPMIKAAQSARGLQPDGVIGPKTIEALAGHSVAERIDKTIVAMEQLRWLPEEFGDRYVFLNAPAFTAAYFEGGEEKLSMRAIYGTPATQTFFFQDEVSFVEFHPFWGVPRSILVNKYLPLLANDSSYLDRNGFDVVNQQGQRVSSTSVNWSQYGANPPYSVRQRPGRGNALGELKIMFPNRHAIYMHDTPDRHLFERDNRALSNGCVRLADPRGMAAAVLGWSRGQIESRLAGQHSRANLETKVPVYVGYFTAWPDAEGTVRFHGDVYSRDARTLTALRKTSELRSPES